MAEIETPPSREPIPDRATRITELVEKIVATVGEHPDCELKREWRRDTQYHKAEFIKDIQAVANSAIQHDGEKFIVVGADEAMREITGCDHSLFDEASIRQALESHLDPVPEFEVLRLKSSKNVQFVVLRLPHQDNGPFVAKSTIKDNEKTYLEQGEIWLRPGTEGSGSTQKRRVRSREELIQLINVNPRVEKEVSERLERIIPAIRLEERTRLHAGVVGAISTTTMTDDEIIEYMLQLLLDENHRHFYVMLENLRDAVVCCWDSICGAGAKSTCDEIGAVKTGGFVDSMRRLTLLGLLVIKHHGPMDWFKRIADVLEEVFTVSVFESQGRVLPTTRRDKITWRALQPRGTCD